MKTFTDAIGRAFAFGHPPKRVVSLVPSLTETLCDLGAAESIAGITDFCIFPAGLDRTRVGGTKNPDVEAIRALQPDLVYMNLEENLERHARAIEPFAPVFVTEPKTVADVESLILTLGAIHACEGRANELVAQLAAERVPARAFTFACPIWKKPWMWCGGDTYVSNLIETAGGTNVLRDRTRYPTIELGEVLALRPGIVFLPDEPYAFCDADADEIASHSPDIRVVGPFPGHLVTWHGTRTILGLRFLRTAIA